MFMWCDVYIKSTFLQGKVLSLAQSNIEVCFAKRRGKNIDGAIWYKSFVQMAQYTLFSR